MKTFMKWPILILMAVVTMCFFTACGGDDNDDPKYQKTEQGVHHITMTFEGNTDGWVAEMMVTAMLPDGMGDIFENGEKINTSSAGFSNVSENVPARNYDFTSTADCNLMTMTFAVIDKGATEPVTVVLVGEVNGIKKNEKRILYTPGESSKTMTFAADGLEFEY